MEHTHNNHILSKTNINRAFIIGIALNFLFVLVEASSGFYYKSLSLLSDAGHNLSDVASLILALIAIKLAEKKATDKLTYGYRKTTILVALLNAVILFIAIGGIVLESINRLHNPKSIEGNGIVIIAVIGIFINGITALFFKREKEKDINIKGAYLHLVADALISLGVVVDGVIIILTKWYWLDSVASLIISVIIIIGTWDLLKESLLLTLDGVPKNIDIENVKSEILEIEEVENIHHLHIWALSTTETALTVHVVLRHMTDLKAIENIKERIRHNLEHVEIHHTTLEIEVNGTECKTEKCIH